jgi:hypothetical protein
MAAGNSCGISVSDSVMTNATVGTVTEAPQGGLTLDGHIYRARPLDWRVQATRAMP